MMGWLVHTLVAVALLLALVLAIRTPVRRLFGPRVAYALWALPAVRSVLPSLPGWHALFVPVAVFRPHQATVGLMDVGSAVALAPADATSVMLGAPVLDPAPAVDWLVPGLFGLWLAGTLILFGGALWRYRRFLSEALAGAVPLMRECGVEVLASAAVPGPVATGLWRRRILLPSDFLTRYTSEERRLAILHEGAHHDRRDIAANLVALAIRATQWWNPLAVPAMRAFREDQELACDATVLADADSREQQSYGRALLKSAVGRAPAMTCTFNTKSQLKRRLRTIGAGPAGRTRTVAGLLFVATAMVAGSMATASGLAASHRPDASAMDMSMPAMDMDLPSMAPAAKQMRRQAAELAAQARDLKAQSAQASVEAGQQVWMADRMSRPLAITARQLEAQSRQLEAQSIGLSAQAQGLEAQRLAMDNVSQVRAAMAAKCARQGAAVHLDADMTTLATCGRDVHAEVTASLQRARAHVLASRDIAEAERARALDGIDAALARQ